MQTLSLYTAHIVLNDLEHSEIYFNQFINQNYVDKHPVGGVITYDGTSIKSSTHSKGIQDDEPIESDESIPFLRQSGILSDLSMVKG